MRLKRVKIFGFKTFADKAEFELGGNMTAVVGSNGCGKSNIVDAILWGLGEGNARHLRAQTSQDVIFSGSSKRKPLGFAEVTLHFDNEDGSLPIDASEVVITRRLNRAGDSDYYINRHSCRLRDVFDLLADSGLGRAGYAIVGQKEIDQALAASPEERRGWVDEAAGVQRYRTRKLDSLKRLSSAKDHLSRVQDILTELDAQREPLRQEAEVAIRYKSLLSSLREVESGLLVVEVARAVREVESLEAQIAESMRLTHLENEKADADELEVVKFTGEVRRLEAELDRQRDAKQSSLTAIERAQASIGLAQQKLRTLSELESNLGEEAANAKSRIEEAEAELATLRQEESEERSALTALQDQSAGAGAKASELRTALNDAEKRLQQAREQHSQRMKREAEIAHSQERRKIASRELQGIDASLPELESGVAEAQDRLQAIELRLREFDADTAALRQNLSSLEAEEAKYAADNRAQLAEKAVLEGRIQGIEATIDAHEGLNQGARAVLEAKKKGRLHADYVPVGEAVEVRKDYAVAIETALGGSANDLIVEAEGDAKAAIEMLKRDRLGRATFQPIPLMRPSNLTSEAERILHRPGVVGRASALVECSSKFRPVIESLLGRVIIVDNIDVAISLARTSGWNRLVTLGGEVVHSGGAVTGGESARQSYGLVQRKADLKQAVEKHKTITKNLLQYTEHAQKRQAERDELRTSLSARENDRKVVLAEVKEAHDWLRNVQHELNSTQKSKARLENELAELLKKQPDVLPEVDVTSAEDQRDVLLKEIASHTADFEGAERLLRDGQSRLRQAQVRLEIAEKRLAAAIEHEALREKRLTNLGPEREKTISEIDAHANEKMRGENSLAAAQSAIDTAVAKRADIQKQIDELNIDVRNARSSAQAAADRCHQSELQRARADARRASSLQRLMEEYGLTEEDALTQEPQVELPTDASTVVNRLRRELKSMGDVNLGAVEAFERLSERSTELTAQREDILAGIEQVEASIHELDKLTRDQFLDTFSRVEKAFSEIFQRLFGGGEGKISLTEPNNVLETGVEIEVTLPGKKRQRLELLSGGERSLCAASFLFALLKVKPSPLVVLDEVDAPLDGRNVERFIELLQDFMSVSQFILITHNPTTIEAAPSWLGVTMQEPGVSTLVPMRLAPTHAAVLN